MAAKEQELKAATKSICIVTCLNKKKKNLLSRMESLILATKKAGAIKEYKKEYVWITGNISLLASFGLKFSKLLSYFSPFV